MKKLTFFLILVIAGLGTITTCVAGESAGRRSDPDLHGVWIPKIYKYQGNSYEIIDGLMVITPSYIIANAIYDLSEKRKPKPDANANFGTYEIIGPGKLVMEQAMQLHWRSEEGNEATVLAEGDGTFFNQDVSETIHYEVKGDTLIFYFQIPGEQSWIMERAAGERY